MSSSIWVIAAWVGAAVLILFLPSIMSSWEGFAIALAVAVLVIWKAFKPRRRGDENDNRPESP